MTQGIPNKENLRLKSSCNNMVKEMVNSLPILFALRTQKHNDDVLFSKVVYSSVVGSIIGFSGDYLVHVTFRLCFGRVLERFYRCS